MKNTIKIGLLTALLFASVGIAKEPAKTLCGSQKCRMASFTKRLSQCTACKASAGGNVKLCPACAEKQGVCRVCLKPLAGKPDAPKQAAWIPVKSKAVPPKDAKIEVFKGKLTKVKIRKGIASTLMRTHNYHLGKYQVFTGAQNIDELDKLVGKTVELKGWHNSMELEGRKLNEIWPTAVRLAEAAENVAAKQAAWTPIKSKAVPAKDAKIEVFKGKLTKVDMMEGIAGISMRTHNYRLGKYDVFTRGSTIGELDKLVGKMVELKGWLNNMELEGKKLNEIWPTAVRAVETGSEDVILKDLQNAPESAEVNDGKEFRIICRGMENHIADGKGKLMGGLMLAPHKHRAKLETTNLEVERVWVLSGDESVGTDIPEKDRPAKNYRFVGIVKVDCNAKWKSGDRITVVVRIRNTETDKTWLVGVKNVPIKDIARPMPKLPIRPNLPVRPKLPIRR